MFLSLVPATIFLLREPRIDHWTKTGVHPLRNTVDQVRRIFQNKDIWICSGLLFLVQISPGLGTPLLYYQTDQLKFDSEFIGMLAMAYGITGLLGSFIYPFLCNRFRLRTLLLMAILCTIASSMTYLGYMSKSSALIIESAAGLGFTLAQLPLFDLAARSATRGSEALAYSLMIALWNLSLSFSDVLGAWLFEGGGFTIPLVNLAVQLPPLTFKDLVWVNAGTTALVLLAIPYLPGRLVDQKEGEGTMLK
jgi:predicted MFS family arabinose efflux permease